ncbi:MAG: tetratricopeptide repeat protein [Planctomycetota bacterium]|jgi:tetratricopeptide (TPR) repeat protein
MTEPSRKLNLPLLALVVLVVGLGAGGYYVFKRGPKAESPINSARRALHDERYAEGEAFARAALKREPNSKLAAQLLIEALSRQGKIAEAKEAARGLIERGEHAGTGRKALCRLALRENDLATADRMARVLTGDDPAFAHQVLAIISDHRGLALNDPRMRLDAAVTMRGLVPLAENDEFRVTALLFACEINVEVAPGLKNPEILKKRVRDDLAAAAASVGKAHQANGRYDAEYFLARVRILSEDPAVAEPAASVLRKYTRGSDARAHAIAQLALFHLRRDEKTEVLNLLRTLDDDYLWRRVLYVLRNGKHIELARKVIEASKVKAKPMLLADVLALGNEAERQQGQEILADMVRDTDVPLGTTVSALRKYVDRAGAEAGCKLADEAKLGDRDEPVLAILHAMLLTSADDNERASEMIRRVAEDVGSVRESGNIMRMLGRGALQDVYLDAQIEKGGDASVAHRLGRVFSSARRKKAAEEGNPALQAQITADLEAVLNDKEAQRLDLLGAWRLGVSVGEPDLAGRLLGRALPMRGPPEVLAASALDMARSTKKRELVVELAQGVAAIAPETTAPAFVREYARLMTREGELTAGVVDDLENAASRDAGSKVPALDLACRIALSLNDKQRAEQLAKSMLEVDPTNAIARELLGAARLADGRQADVVDMYATDAPASEGAYKQYALALLGIGRGAEAVKVAEAAVELYPQSTPVYVVLARIHAKNGDDRKALSVLNVAPLVPLVALLRAELLVRLDDLPMAEQMYLWLLRATRYRSEQAWSGAARIMAKLGRTAEFVEFVGAVLDKGLKADGEKEIRASLYFLRAETLQQDGRVDSALRDYEEAIRLNPKLWRAQNNAAWFIATVKPARVDDAVKHIKAALEIQKDHPSLLDTAAEVYAAKRDWDAALAHVDRAIAAVGEKDPRAANYSAHKALILRRAGREAEARALADTILGNRDLEGTPAAKRARELIDAIELAERVKEQEKSDSEKPAGAGDG